MMSLYLADHNPLEIACGPMFICEGQIECLSQDDVILTVMERIFLSLNTLGNSVA